jgi:hypothetical protein
LSSFLVPTLRDREGVRGWVKTETRNKQNIAVTPGELRGVGLGHLTTVKFTGLTPISQIIEPQVKYEQPLIPVQ